MTIPRATLEGSDILKRLREGICDSPCKVKNVASGCQCAEAAVEIERGRSAWKGAMEEREWWEKRAAYYRSLVPAGSLEEH